MFTVQPHHGRNGRVFKPIGGGRSVLVAFRGDEISDELARECGLLPPEPAPFERGAGLLPEKDEPAVVHKGERVVPAKAAAKTRSAAKKTTKQPESSPKLIDRYPPKD